MKNCSSNVNHIAIRSCVICRTKKKQPNLRRFIIFKKEIAFNFKENTTGRGYYVCDNDACLRKLEKWLKRKK